MHLEPGSQEQSKPSQSKKITDYRNNENQKNGEVKQILGVDFPDSAQIERPEYNSKYQVEKIALKNTSFKFVPSGSNNKIVIDSVVPLLFTILLFKVK